MAECRNYKRRGHYKKICRSRKQVQYVERTKSSTEDDNWEYDRIQKIKNKKQKKGIYNVTLLVNNVPIKFIIDSGPTVTLLPEFLFNKITPIEPLKINNKDLNCRKINFTGQTKATVKTNKETIEVLLLITKTQTAQLMGPDWMERLHINLSSNNDAFHINNKKVDNTDRRIIKNYFTTTKRKKISWSK